MARRDVRDAVVTSIEQACPRCGAARGPRQEYCVECGLRLPPVTGTLASLRRRWIRRFGWYPGDWIWTSLLGLLVAVAGASVAIVLAGKAPKGGTTIVAPPPSSSTTSTQATSTTTTTPLPKPPEPSTTTGSKTTTTSPTTTTPPPPNGKTVWPAATAGWTLVLESSPLSGGRAAPAAVAARAARSGLPQVGVLDSGDWSSLHPGYYVVFSGIYTSNADAQAALAKAQSSGFGHAYVRPIVK